ncbi:hypothetical protein [Cytobacillus horneckiae]|uniref:hypothetical protein n=1 Tax=Cytobacillus horneckiae TaxID=549687 RepID=UPI002DC02F96|nr:hypothetical protein [Cytobacillus horneckiae]MEC1157822.1 hypothetical protein [Cytobacillus horneckiae]MED2940716.1 hypothetical protein [Cytobacillus horneckiae]
MNTQYLLRPIEQKNFQNFDLIYEGIKKKGLYLLEYNDSYLKDAFITQLAEQYINNGSNAMFLQEEMVRYSLRDIFLCRTLFKQNPHNFPSFSQMTKDSIALLKPPFAQQFNTLEQNMSIVSVESKYSSGFLEPMFKAIDENSRMKIVIIDSHTDYFLKTNLYPQLTRTAFKEDLTILFTSKNSSEESLNRNKPIYSFYLHSNYPDLYSQSDSKELTYDFELDISTPSNNRLKSYFTLFPSSGYCMEG